MVGQLKIRTSSLPSPSIDRNKTSRLGAGWRLNMMRWPKLGGKRPTLLLRCLLLIAAELAVNALLWIVAAIVSANVLASLLCACWHGH